MPTRPALPHCLGPRSTPFRSAKLAIITLALAVGTLGGCAGEASVVREGTEMDEDEMEQTGNPMREGPAGCYIGAERRCNCEIIEAECTEDMGWTWVPEGCASCAE